MKPKNNDHRPKIRLPIEVILLIIDHLISDTAGPQPFLPATSLITKTLLALTTVSRATHTTASRLLWQNCLYIDTRERLDALRKSVSKKSVITGRVPWKAYAPARMFLCPFHLANDFAVSEYSPVPDETSLIPRLDMIPDDEPFPQGFSTIAADDDDESFWSRPYETDEPWLLPDSPMYSELKTLSVFQDIRKILVTLAPVLKTLVVDMPLRTLYRQDDHYGIRQILRKGFEALTDIEEIVSVEDELYLDSMGGREEPQVWAQWPKLKRLALYNVLADEELWQNMLSCPQLETAIFIRADRVGHVENPIDVKREWSRAWVAGNSREATTNSGEGRYPGPEITIAFCNTEPELPHFDSYIPSWNAMDPENKICVLTVPTDSITLHKTPEEFPWRNDPIVVSQEWVRNQALTGTLWKDIKRESLFMSSKSE
jgi:hypothetical protein